MMRVARRSALVYFAVSSLAVGCGADTTTSSECKSGSVDAKAQADLADASGPAQEVYAFDASLLGSTKRNFVFTMRNSASKLSALPLKIQAVRLIETDSAGASVATAAFQCTTGSGGDCATAT